MIKLIVPANLTSIPKIRINMGIITSPPATPKRLLIIPIITPHNTATVSSIYKLLNVIPADPNVMKLSVIRSNPIIKSRINNIFLNRISDILFDNPIPKYVHVVEPIIIAIINKISG